MPKLKPKPDRHKSKLVRLPNEYMEALVKAQAVTRRPYTAEIQVALDAHLATLGIVVAQPKGAK